MDRIYQQAKKDIGDAIVQACIILILGLVFTSFGFELQVGNLIATGIILATYGLVILIVLLFVRYLLLREKKQNTTMDVRPDDMGFPW